MTASTIHLIPERAPLTTAHEVQLLVLVLLAIALAGCAVGWLIEWARNRVLEEQLEEERAKHEETGDDVRALAVERDELEAELASLRRAQPFDQERA